MRYFNFLMVAVITFTFVSCNDSDDDSNSEAFNACLVEPFPGVANVTASNFQVSLFDMPDERGYFISATLTNANDYAVSGEPTFVLRENGSISNYSTINTASAFSCLDIDANSSCDFELNIYLLQSEVIDPNISLLCFYYFDE